MISVIVPVYNAEKYLDKCIESIANQTYRDLEIILVDDGSPDNCPAICDEWAKKDKRIKVIHKPNGGVSSARNAGLDSYTGEYVTFIDSDDYIEVNMFERIFEALSAKDVDLVFIREKSVNIKGNTIYINGDMPSGEILYLDKEKAAERIIGMQINGMCDKTYKRSLVDGIRVFEGKKHGEDLLFNIQVLEKVKTAALIDDILYSYVSNEDSITHIPFNEHTVDGLFFKDKAEKIIENKFPQYLDLARRRSFVARQSVVRKIIDEKLQKQQKALLGELTQYLNEKYDLVRNHLSKKEKLEYFLYTKAKILYLPYIHFIEIVKVLGGKK